jgi:hypothetical protein
MELEMLQIKTFWKVSLQVRLYPVEEGCTATGLRFLLDSWRRQSVLQPKERR